MSEAAGRDVGTTAAAQSYFATVLPAIAPVAEQLSVPQQASAIADGDELELTT
jgi:hypothetical protein